MKAAIMSWTMPDIDLVYPIKTLSRACLMPLLIVSQRLAPAMAVHQGVPRPERRRHTPQTPGAYSMLVESDVRGGVRGILP
jgi:hypothetical protein